MDKAYCFALIFLLSLGVYQAEGKDSVRKFILTPEQCLLTGEDNGSVKTMAGDNTVLNCDLSSTKLLCGQKSNPEEYDVPINEKDLFVGRSKSGNIFILGDLAGKRFSIASSHLIADKGMLMTKHCTGRIK